MLSLTKWMATGAVGGWSSLTRWIAAGAVGGWICAFMIFSITGLIGKSGNTGTEYIGYWSPISIFFAVMYGIPGGVICLAVCRIIFFWASDEALFDNAGKLTFATVFGGVAGGFSDILVSAFGAIICFVFALTWFSITTKKRVNEIKPPADQEH